MIIVSQDKKDIFNFDKIANIYINCDNEIKADGETMGIYKTEERAKGVLQEIIKAIKGKTIIQTTVEGMKCENLSNNIFEMPKE